VIQYVAPALREACRTSDVLVSETLGTILGRGRASARQGTINKSDHQQSVATGEFKAHAMFKLGLQYGKFKVNVSATTWFIVTLLALLKHWS
jgi:hypothetical protein